MGLSLADAAVRGMKSTDTIADEKQTLLAAGDITGLITLNRGIFGGATMMAEEDDDADDDADDDDDDDADDGDDDDDDDSDDDDDDDKKAKAKKPDPKDVRITELSAEAKKKRLRIRTQAQKIAELEAENAKLKKAPAKPKPKKDEDEDDSDSEALTTLKSENTTLKERLVRQDLRSEFNDLTTGEKPLAVFIDPKSAFRLLDLDDVEIDEDGTIDGLDDAIKELAKDKPYLLKPKAKAKDDEDDEEPGRRRTGQPTGSRKKGQPNREKLVSKYPALRR
jgi:hypothetical protein